MEDKVLTLSKPIQAHGEEVHEIKFRAPLGADILACGAPTIFMGDGDQVRPDVGAVGAYISRLCGIPTSSVKQMAAPDFMAATGVVLGFFSPTATPGSS